MSKAHDESKMACMGAPTVTHGNACGEMEECQACGTKIAHDLVDHSFFGFAAGCEETRN